jgi:NADH-quinone oxidoreductase subunit M
VNDLSLITVLTLVPLLGGVLVIGLGELKERFARGLAFATCLLSLALALAMWKVFDPAAGTFQFEESHDWIAKLGIKYHVGVDGLGLLMVQLTAIVTPMAMLASGRISGRSGLYYGLILFLQSGLFGTFTALNFFHWFLFWELSLIPAFFLIRLWGGPQRAPAATQFFIYTMVGSIALLLSFLAIFLATDQVSDFITLADWARDGRLIPAIATRLGWQTLSAHWLAVVIFFGAFLGFAVKVPLMPFHTWLPAAYAEAPTAVTMLLTGLMSKMGVYGFVRILLPIFGEVMHWERVRTVLLVLAVITIVFSAGAAFAQKDLKRILAYSSINHLGYCLLAIFAVAIADDPARPGLATEKAAALNGVFLQMFNHGLTAATLFWFVALIERRSNGVRGLNEFGGLRKVAPVFCGLMGIALFSSLGLPGLNGFVGEFLIFKGVFPLATCSASLSVIGLLVTAIFILTILQRVFNGPLNEKWSKWPDLTLRERAQLAVPMALMFVLGICPQLVLGMINATTVHMVEQLKF